MEYTKRNSKKWRNYLSIANYILFKLNFNTSLYVYIYI